MSPSGAPGPHPREACQTPEGEGRLVLVLGGARSGKSDFARRLASFEGGDRVIFVATAEALDPEMADRIRRHRASRPHSWVTVEAPRNVAACLEQAWSGGQRVVVLDCLGLLVSNLLPWADDPTGPESAEPDSAEDALERAVLAEIAAFENLVRSRQATAIVVSNEVGSGVVPPYPSGRRFRDVLGRINQRVAERADEVWLMVAGLPLRLKPGLASPPPWAL